MAKYSKVNSDHDMRAIHFKQNNLHTFVRHIESDTKFSFVIIFFFRLTVNAVLI